MALSDQAPSTKFFDRHRPKGIDTDILIVRKQIARLLGNTPFKYLECHARIYSLAWALPAAWLCGCGDNGSVASSILLPSALLILVNIS